MEMGSLFILTVGNAVLAEALFGVLAPFGAGEVIAGVYSIVAAAGALAPQIILEKLYGRPAVSTRELENIFGLPVTHILPRARKPG